MKLLIPLREVKSGDRVAWKREGIQDNPCLIVKEVIYNDKWEDTEGIIWYDLSFDALPQDEVFPFYGQAMRCVGIDLAKRSLIIEGHYHSPEDLIEVEREA